MDYIEFQDRTEPLGYLVTFRTYGSWLHGDERGSVDRRFHNKVGTHLIAPGSGLHQSDERLLKGPSVVLDGYCRPVVESAIREFCQHREYLLHSVNVRTNHVHCVVSAACKPEPMMSGMKAYSSRRLRERGITAHDARIWARHGSTRYLWTQRSLELAVLYVAEGQGERLVSFDDFVLGVEKCPKPDR